MKEFFTFSHAGKEILRSDSLHSGMTEIDNQVILSELM